ncbi:5'-nucleotidase, lipoprotein e(P4) family [Novosphingobium sp. JCM 18896]|uniref:5'-nucleotidase, lipoprotein e(P4) family n=1 Tax=Novosphingobium sp. JCM 18896 TaxID=2989731 RepID=UPI002223C02E|nr:HAD family acid phosphatase [Novosphingobium sp. JCM 18896]MCW1431569.1 acid phosphatase [Novosphingobium sp. JCM 18896]
MKNPAPALILALAGCAAAPQPAPVPVSAVVANPAAAEKPPEGMQYLYGSAEAAALSVQAYNVLVDAVRQNLATSKPPQSAIVMPEGTPVPSCAGKPLAAVFDMDETAVLNTGFEYNDARTGQGYNPARWARWEQTGAEKVDPVPGAKAAFAALRAMNVTPIINTNRGAASAEQTAKALAFAGLGEFRHGETLFLKGDVDGKSGKDGRRLAIAAKWCVVALGGDQLGDFTDALTGVAAATRRQAAMTASYEALWGRRWFLLPNPVYGSGLGSGWDDTFPAERRWADPAAQGVK